MIGSRPGYWLVLAAIIFCLFLVAMARSSVIAQVKVPQECIDLAMKYGRPLDRVMSRFKVNQAKAELKMLSDDEPLVKKCRDAVARLERR